MYEDSAENWMWLKGFFCLNYVGEKYDWMIYFIFLQFDKILCKIHLRINNSCFTFYMYEKFIQFTLNNSE